MATFLQLGNVIINTDHVVSVALIDPDHINLYFVTDRVASQNTASRFTGVGGDNPMILRGQQAKAAWEYFVAAGKYLDHARAAEGQPVKDGK